MRYFKAIYYKLYYMWYSRQSKKQFKNFVAAQPATTSIFIVDVDNTIANTWPTFLRKWTSEYERLENIEAFKNMHSYLQKQTQTQAIAFVYLTARNIRYKSITQTWLQQHNFLFNNAQLFLVNKPNEKLAFLKKACYLHKNIVYLDDLSYNHETGNTKTYTNIIEAVKKMPLAYFDASFIDGINKTI